MGPREDVESDGWGSTPATVLDFSAVAWFFARRSTALRGAGRHHQQQLWRIAGEG
jgi:hypothetical protein